MNIGLIGCGRVSELHLLAYKHIPRANVVAVSDINLDRAKAFAQKYSIEKAFRDTSDLFEMKNLDYVDICTPTSTHAKIACDAAKYGQNISLEKPMARNSTECDKIIHEISKQGVKLSICHNQLFLPLVMRVKAMVDSGAFPLTHFKVSIKESPELIGMPAWTMTPEHGGILWESGAHAAYLLLHFLSEIDEVSAVGKKIKYPVYDHLITFLSTPSQATGVIEVMSLTKREEILFDFIRDDGKLIRILDYVYLMDFPEKRPTRFLQGCYWDQKMIMKKWIKSLISNLHYRNMLIILPHYTFFNKFMDALKNNLEPPVTPENGRQTIRLLECINESLNKNLPIKLNK